jgi:uncharacterized membrane protein
MPESSTQRLAYIDWLRGLACVLMFQTHCYDSWLGGSARNTSFFGWSQLLGTLPAPLFLFLAGVSVALVTDRLRRKAVPATQIAKSTIVRGTQIFGLALLFRVQEFVLGFRSAPWTDLLRVDVLNAIGISIVLMGIACRFAKTRAATVTLAAVCAAAIALATPPLWTTWRPSWLPWFLESYINGVHIYHVPQPWLFPIFPWTAFAFAGLAVGFLLFGDRGVQNAASTLAICGAAGILVFELSLRLDALPVHMYAVYDYWHTSPNFFLARVAVLLMIAFVAYVWCRWGPTRWVGKWGFSPLIQLGQTSLLVYWVHIEFVYGSLSILPRRAETIPMASLGLLIIFISMVLLSIARTRYGRRTDSVSPARPPVTMPVHEK